MLLFLFFLSWMPRRVLWPCWHRPALKLVNQTPPLPPSWPPSPPVVWETRSPPAGHPSPENSTSPWRTNPASSLTPSHQATAVRMFWWRRGLQIKRLSGCQMEAPVVVHVHLSLPIHGHPALVLLPCTVRASPTDKVIPLPYSPHHTRRLHTWTANLGAQSQPARTVIATTLVKKTQMQLSQAWMVHS